MMSDQKQALRKTPELPVSGPAEARAPGEKESGRVVGDARGNATWEWRDSDGQYRKDPTTTMVEKLAAPDLRIESTIITKAPDGASAKASGLAGGGFNPYESSAGYRDAGSAASRSPAIDPLSRPRVTIRPRKPGLLERLQDWLDRKERSGSR
jgi:hypothetical protein